MDLFDGNKNHHLIDIRLVPGNSNGFCSSQEWKLSKFPWIKPLCDNIQTTDT